MSRTTKKEESKNYKKNKEKTDESECSTTMDKASSPPNHSSNPIWKGKTSVNLFVGEGVQLNENTSVIDSINNQIKH